MREPLLIPCLGAITGIGLSALFDFEPGELLFAAVLLATLIVAARSHPVHGAIRRTVYFALSLVAGIALERYHRPARPAPLPPAASLEGELRADLCVVESSSFFDGRFRFLVEFPSGVRAQVAHYPRDGIAPPARLAYGQRVRFTARYRAPDRFRNPGSFDYPAYLARRDIHWLATIPARGKIEILPGAPCGSSARRLIAQTRLALSDRIHAAFPQDPYTNGMMAALLLGDDTEIRKLWTDSYRRTGTFHALVVSGQHLTVLCAVLIFAFNLLIRRAWVAAVLSVAVAWGYAFLAGAEAPVLRAAGGLSLFALARFYHRRGRILNILAAVALGFLILDPHQIFEASFQLSFAAVAALGAIATPLLEPRVKPFSDVAFTLHELDLDPQRPPWLSAIVVELRLLARTLSLYTRLPERASQILLGFGVRAIGFTLQVAVLTAAVQFALALPMILFFHRFSVTGVIANLLVTLPIEAALILGFAGLVTQSATLIHWAGDLLDLTRRMVDFCGAWEPQWRIPTPPLALALGLISLVVFLAIALRYCRFRIPTALAAAALLAVVLWHPFAPRIYPRELELTAVDVGQGDGLFLALPRGQTVAIDAPGLRAFDTGEDVISPYLWTRSLKHLDVLVLTHAHADHLGGLGALLDNFTPREIWTGLIRDDLPAWIPIRERALARGVRIRPLHSGQSIHYGGVTFDVLAPFPGDLPAREPHNNDSLVLLVRYGERRFLLAGDAENAVESRILEQHQLDHIDVLKVGHHGSRTSTSEPLLDATRPAFALISAGRFNRFRHPHPMILARLESRGVRILRTDRQGLVTFRTDGHRLSLETPEDALAANPFTRLLNPWVDYLAN
ncbi:MAG: ComEC/Rec2 family competence protein [Bryobacteraceae bacterium]|nr:ComEC/Rec2 family competence protein [Bryobacteraceae bacterium]